MAEQDQIITRFDLTLTADAELVTAGQKVLALIPLAEAAEAAGTPLDPAQVLAVLRGDLSAAR